MQQSVRTITSAAAPPDENLILADIERLLGDNLSTAAWNDGVLAVAPAGRRGVRTVPLLFAVGVALAIALVPAGLRKVSTSADPTHQAAND